MLTRQGTDQHLELRLAVPPTVSARSGPQKTGAAPKPIPTSKGRRASLGLYRCQSQTKAEAQRG